MERFDRRATNYGNIHAFGLLVKAGDKVSRLQARCGQHAAETA